MKSKRLYLPPMFDNSKVRPRVAVAMSGGVDSSMVAYLLSEQGDCDLIGLTAWTLDGPGKCCNDALINAGRICENLGITYDVVDLRAKFAHYVMDYYENSYRHGLTPNPCVECNRYIKWEAMLAYAKHELNVDFVATGHYAKVEHNENSLIRIFRGKDRKKDQTYMLSRIKKEDLCHTIFPLADFDKGEILALARKMNIPTAFSKESQDVCFAVSGQSNYIGHVLGIKKGLIVDYESGKVLGEHDGYYFFTPGQRKGLNIAVGKPIYVIKTDPSTNIVYAGDLKHLNTFEFIVKDVNWINEPMCEEFESMVKIRYNTPSTLAKCIKRNGNIEVKFKLPVSAITTGQVAAFYNTCDMELWGGGYIETHLVHENFMPEKQKIPKFDESCSIFRNKS